MRRMSREYSENRPQKRSVQKRSLLLIFADILFRPSSKFLHVFTFPIRGRSRRRRRRHSADQRDPPAAPVLSSLLPHAPWHGSFGPGTVRIGRILKIFFGQPATSIRQHLRIILGNSGGAAMEPPSQAFGRFLSPQRWAPGWLETRDRDDPELGLASPD